MTEPIGFIGLGHLGLPIATNLVDAGYAIRIFNRTASKADPLVARGVPLVSRPADTVTPGGVVVTLVWDDAALDAIVSSDGLLDRLGPGGVHIAMTTVAPDTARRLAALHASRGIGYVEAPIFGRPAAATARKLLIPIAGAADAKARVRPILEAMGGERIFDFGAAVGAATAVKLAGNFLLVSAARSLVEAITVADKTGVDPGALVDMLTTTLFAAPIYQSYGKMIVDKAPVTISGIPLKDIGLFKRTADQVGSATPLANRLHEMLSGQA